MKLEVFSNASSDEPTAKKNKEARNKKDSSSDSDCVIAKGSGAKKSKDRQDDLAD